MANPFYVEPADPLKALMGFDQSYQQARQQRLQDQMQQGRLEAAQALQSGQDPRPALAKLLGVGDVQGAQAIATYAHQQAQDKLAAATLAQTGVYQQGELRLGGERNQIARDSLEQGKITRGVTSSPLSGEVSGYEIGPNGMRTLPPATTPAAGPATQPELNPPSNVGYRQHGTQNLSDQKIVGVDKQDLAPGQPLPQAQAPVKLSAADLMAKYGGKPGDGKDWEYLAQQSPAVQEKIVRMSTHDLNPANYSTRIAPGAGVSARDAITTATAKFDSGYNQQDYPLIQTARQAFNTGPQGNTTKSLNVFVQHVGVARDLVNALSNGDNQLINRARNAWQDAFGYTAPGNLEGATGVLRAELSKAVLGTEGALGDRELLSKNLQNFRTPDQINGTLDVYEKMAAGQLLGLEKQYQTSTKKNDYRSKLFPETVKALGISEGAPGAGSSQAQPSLPPAAQSQLKEGLQTTFGNGQVWTLQNGQPVRVK